MSIDLIAKIAPKNDGFQGMIDNDQILGVDDGFLDQDNMASNSATAFCSQQSIKAYVDGTSPVGAYVPLQPVADVSINPGRGDYDFIISGDTAPYLFYLNAGLDNVSIGTTGGSGRYIFNVFHSVDDEVGGGISVTIDSDTTTDLSYSLSCLDLLNQVRVDAGVTLTGNVTIESINGLLSTDFDGALDGALYGSYVRAGIGSGAGTSAAVTYAFGYRVGVNIYKGTIDSFYPFSTANQGNGGDITKYRGVSLHVPAFSANNQERYGLYFETMVNPGAYTGTTMQAIHLGGSSSPTTSRDGIWWGTDVNLYRGAANQLETDDTFKAGGYRSSDNSPGITTTFTNGDGATVTVKNGLITSIV